MAGTLLLGVDIGTSSSKGVLCTPEGDIVASTMVHHDTSFPRPGRAEHDADALWWGEFVEICRRLLADSGRGDEVGAVGVSAIGPCMLPLDENGHPLRPGVLYGIDTRAAAEIAWLEERHGADALFALGGMPLSSQAVGPKILWLRNHEPELFARTAMVHSSSDYIAYRLTGEHVIDRHTASAFNPLFNIERLEWDERFAEGIIELDRLPRLLDTTEVAGCVTAAASAATGLPQGIPVTPGTIDVAAEALSVGVTEPGQMMLMYGSTFFLLNLVAEPRTDPRLWPAAYSLPGRRAIMGGMATSGLITKWFREELAGDERRKEEETGESAYAQLCDLAATIPAGSEGLICLPYFAGERTPLHNPDARGMFAGLTLRHTRGHLYRSIMEGVGYGVRHHLDIMREAGAMPEKVIAVGGGTQGDLWVQIVSDITGVSQLIPERALGASDGDAMLAGLASGIVDSVDRLIGTWTRIARRVDPNPEHASVYDAGYRIYRELYERTTDQQRALSELGRA